MQNKNKNKNLGSSETIREASQKNFFQAYIPYSPKHRRLNFTFLEWFIGFFEGEGNFESWDDKGKIKFAAQLTQNDEVLLRNIRTQLGFGRIVNITANDGKKYPQLRFDNRQNLLRLIHLFIGNIRLKKVQASFLPWAHSICEDFNTEFPINLEGIANQPLSFNNAWLSGFFQADGQFNAQYLKDRGYQKGYLVTLSAYIEKKQELEFLQEFSSLFGGFLQLRNTKKSIYRVTIGTEFKCLIDYINRFPLRGKKKITQNRWIRLVNYIEKYDLPKPGTKTFNSFLHLVKKVNACSRICSKK